MTSAAALRNEYRPEISIFTIPEQQRALQEIARRIGGLFKSISHPNQIALVDLPTHIEVLDKVALVLDFCEIGGSVRVAALLKKLAPFEESSFCERKEPTLDQKALEALSDACRYARNNMKNAYKYQQGLALHNRVPGDFQISEFAVCCLKSIIKGEKGKKIGEKGITKRSHIEFYETPSLRYAQKTVLHNEETNEAAVLSFLRHNNIAELGLVLNLNKLTFTMEYAPLGDLDTLSWENKLQKTLTREMFLEGLKGLVNCLVFIHEKGWKHRDIKPANILVIIEDKKVVFKFCDWELSGILEDRRGKGTIEYAAKEVFERGAIRGTPIDMWSFGMTGLELLLRGFNPYQSIDLEKKEATRKIMNQLKSSQEEFDNKIREEIENARQAEVKAKMEQYDQEGDLVKAFMKCLRIEPSQRSRAPELLKDLEKTGV